MIVYRVEYQDRWGPYHSFRNGKWRGENVVEMSSYLSKKHNRLGDWRHPIAKLIRHYNDGGYCCGFTSVRKLKNWFKGFQNKLHKHKFKIAIYEVDEIFEDDFQCIFRFANAKLLRKVPVTASQKKFIV
jgi:hypothetical protein